MGSGSVSSSLEDPEASPLVAASPVEIVDKNNVLFSPTNSTELKNRKSSTESRRSSNAISPTKPHSPLDRESNV